MSALLIVEVLAGVFTALLLFGLVFAPGRAGGRSLEVEYVKLMRLGPDEGRAHLQRRLAALRQSKPGHSEQWYLRWLVDDLRRAKRQ